jgi:hypothetical protein
MDNHTSPRAGSKPNRSDRSDRAEVDSSDFRFAMVPEGLIFSGLSDAAVRVHAALQRIGREGLGMVSYRDIGKRLGPTSSKTRNPDSTGMSEAKVQRAVTELERAGWLEVTRRRDRFGVRLPSVYKPLRSPVAPVAGFVGESTGFTHDPSTGFTHDPSTGFTHDPCNEERTTREIDERKDNEPDASLEADASQSTTPSSSLQLFEPQPLEPQPLQLVAERPQTEPEWLCHRLADYVAADPPGSKRPTVTDDGWVVDMERMLRIDGRSAEQVANAMRWIFEEPDGEFWIANIRSPKKLRAQFDRLRADAMRKRKSRKETPGETAMRVMAEPRRPTMAELLVMENQRVADLAGAAGELI